MRKNKFFLLLIVTTLCAYGSELQKENGCNCVPESKIFGEEVILEQFAKGKEKVAVLINLRQPQIISEQQFNWDSKESLRSLHQEIKKLQHEAIKTIDPDDIELGYQFENQPTIACELTIDALNQILENELVESVEPDYVLEEHLAQGIPLMNGMVYRSVYNGQGVAVAICDSGVDYTHPKLGGGGFPNSKVIGGYDTGDNDSDPFPTTPQDPHGTSCAGIVAGDLGDVNDYIGGVAHGAKIYALKTKKSSGDITTSTLAGAWDWCTSHKNDNPAYPILVISTSIGGTRYYSPCDSSNTTLANAANNATNAGITLFVSAGNNGYCDSISVPACLTNTISVGAVYDADFGLWYACLYSESCANPKFTEPFCPGGYYVIDTTYADRVTSFSNIANFLDILAPANNNYTTDMVGTPGYSTTDYANDFGGTSAACPYSAGAAACIQSAAKEITGHYLTPSRIKQILITTGDPITDTKVAITKPRVNLGRAIEYLLNNDCADITIGSGSLNWSYPFHTNWHDSRTQVIYKASELGSRGFITSLAMHVITIPGQTMNNWTIRMKHTSLNAFSTCTMDTAGWTTVYQKNEPQGSTGWPTYTFTTPFYYNGINNLIVDFSFNNTSYTTNGQVKYSTPGGNRCVYAYSDSTNGDPLNWGGAGSPTISCGNFVPNIWFVICPITSGDLQPDGNVDMSDLAIMANQWLQSPGIPSADIMPAPAGDNIVNFLDFAELASNWLE
ncbi:MAG: S8 family serine peptidase [Phycisphaerales bacterium]